MTGLTNNITAVLEFSKDQAPDLWSLAGTFVWCLRQADVRIYRHDLAFNGASMTFETDHGRIRISAGRSELGAPTLSIGASAALEGSREVARQICYQLSQRVLARFEIASILWEPTLQQFAPPNFKWATLRDMPRHVNDTMRRAIMMNVHSAVA